MQLIKIHLTKKQFEADIERAVEIQSEYIISPEFIFSGFFNPDGSDPLLTKTYNEYPFLKHAIKIGVLDYLKVIVKNFIKWRFKATDLQLFDEAQIKLAASHWNAWRIKHVKTLTKELVGTVESYFDFCNDKGKE